jgi:hypothetical protein
MAAPEMPFDPRQPGYPGDPMLNGGAAYQRPGGLTAICVIAIILGAFGLLGSLAGLGGQAMKKDFEKAFAVPQQQGTPPEFLKAQTEMAKKMQAVNDRYAGFTTGIALLNLVCASCLLGGAIMTLVMNPKGRTFLIAVFAAAIVFEIVRCIVGIFMQLDIAAAMSDAMQQMMKTGMPQGGRGAEQGAAFVGTLTKVGAVVGMAVTVGWGLAKMVFYGVSAGYLRRPNIRRLFQRSTTGQV